MSLAKTLSDSLTWEVSCFWRIVLERNSLAISYHSEWPFALRGTRLLPWLDFPGLPLLYQSKVLLGSWHVDFSYWLDLFSHTIIS